MTINLFYRRTNKYINVRLTFYFREMKQVLYAVLFLVLGVFSGGRATNTKLKEVFSWKQLDYKFEDESARNLSLETGELIKEHNLPLGLEVWKDKVFITVPRWKSGVPSTLNYVPKNGKILFSLTKLL